MADVSSLRISQLAARTGVPASTLRYYESTGLLPAERTPAGYRRYGEQAVDRLAFISSAKLLGLSLEDIRDLLGVWERGVCAAVRTTMRPLVAARIADADQRQAELRAFTAHLAAVHAQLSQPGPAGPCGPDCGCTDVDPPAADDDQSWRTAPIACTLDETALGERTEQWQRMAAAATDRAELPDGVLLSFPASPELAAELAALATTEQGCCAFFDFTLYLTPATLELTVRAPEAARPLLADLIGAC